MSPVRTMGNLGPANSEQIVRVHHLPAGIRQRCGDAALCGKLRHKVMIYIDWSRFAELCREAGASFSFLGGKAVRRSRSEPTNMRLPIIGGCLAQVTIEDVKTNVTDPTLVRMLFDGTTLQTVIKNMIAHAEIMMRE